MVNFGQIPVHTEFIYANRNYVKLSDSRALSLQGYGLIPLQPDDIIILTEDTDGESQTDIT